MIQDPVRPENVGKGACATDLKPTPRLGAVRMRLGSATRYIRGGAGRTRRRAAASRGGGAGGLLKEGVGSAARVPSLGAVP